MPLQRGGGLRQGGQAAGGQPSRSPGVRPDLQGFNVPFDRDKFTQLIEAHGYNVLWEKATWCPFLRGPNPKDHDILCQQCRNGFFYYEACETKMHVASLNVSQQYFAYGRFDSGKAQISAFPEFKVSFWDRITLVDSRARHIELVKRQRDSLRDRLKFDPICVTKLIWATSDTAYGTAVEKVDFTIDADTFELVWSTTNRPGADTWYSVVYFFRPSYIVLDVPHHVRDQVIPKLDGEDRTWEFPVQVIGQLDRFIRDEGEDPSSEGEVTNPFPVQGANRWQGA